MRIFYQIFMETESFLTNRLMLLLVMLLLILLTIIFENP